MARTTTSPELTPTRICTGRAALALDLVRVEADPPLHPERGVAGADGVVLVGDRRPEQRHDPVAHDLVDGALVVMDRLHHPLEHGIEELPRLLGVAVGEQLHRALQVGEEHRHLLALALEGGLRGEDPFGQVFGCIGPLATRTWARSVGQRSSGAAHCPQNLWPGGLAAPQDEQTDASGAAHWPQNVMPAGFSAWHRGQRISPTPSSRVPPSLARTPCTAPGFLDRLRVRCCSRAPSPRRHE